VIAAWPDALPLAALIAGDRAGRTRHSLLASPTRTLELDGLDALDAQLQPRRRSPSALESPSGLGPGWIVAIPYAAGFEAEPTGLVGSPGRAKILLARIDHGWVHDNRAGAWSAFGGAEGLPPQAPHEAAFRLGPVQGLERREAYERATARAVELIRAGDLFQVNLTHRLWAEFRGSPRALMASLCGALAPWHGCYLETARTAIASASPELFLELKPDGAVITRPMKGTRPGHDGSLALSGKDAAELAMIVDLMRNDLGRVCAVGSVRVREARAIEPHGPGPALWQGVATVAGRLDRRRSLADLLRAALPPGSVTGAPKVRAMQVIGALEPGLGFDESMPARGHYCGAVGYLGDDGAASLSVAIRTAVVELGLCHYPVGAGIVADSRPEAEWAETLVKARPFLRLGAP
jgi:anthranilate/para-aminobenzoate synthase component I